MFTLPTTQTRAIPPTLVASVFRFGVERFRVNADFLSFAR